MNLKFEKNKEKTTLLYAKFSPFYLKIAKLTSGLVLKIFWIAMGPFELLG